ncbi:MAG TPA: FtsK/SpoIIIE domain-containing protein [Pedococcus sp.]|uniref:FtsK/SpoIIIE domain-containing protein n=1 Tax=Pedococcus sp. TaxID=2860345 RepID=UPI002F939C79
MRLQMTIVRADRPGEPLEVEVDADPADTAADLSAALATVLGEPSPRELHCRGRALDRQAPLGVGALVDGAAITVGAVPAPSGPGRDDPRAPLALVVVGGPDAGRQVDLRRGTTRIGRSGEADLVIADPELSRVHAVVDAGPDGVTLHDAGSTNGSVVDGEPVGRDGRRIDTTSLVTLGSTRLRLRSTSARPAALTRAREGVRLVNRGPRIRRDVEPSTLTLPSPPQAPTRASLPWVAMLVPVPVGVVLALVFSPLMLVFTLMSPLLVAGNALSDRLSGRRRYAAQLAEHAAAVGRVEADAAAAVSDEQRRRRWALPDGAEILAIASAPSARLWERRPADPDVLRVRVGTWSAPAQLRIVDPGGASTRRPVVADVPCPVSLDEVGVLGVAGPRPQVEGLARLVVGQLAVLHSPLDLSLWVLACDRAAARSWHWVSRLPHCRGSLPPGLTRRFAVLDPSGEHVVRAVRELQAIVARRRDTGRRGPEPWTGERTVVVVDGVSRLRSTPGLAELMDEGPSVGVVFVALDDSPDRLPTEAGAVLELSPDRHACALRTREGALGAGLVPDGSGAWWSERLSRSLAPLRDATPRDAGAGIPETARLLDLLGFDARDARQVSARWQRAPRSTTAVVGIGPDGPHALDLRTDGPHILVGGTTGSGKSEFLQTLVASLAAGNRPDQLSFVLVDYKGGSAFSECAALPHTVGLVTDLDHGLAERALVSLTAELKRRERLFADVGAADLDGYERLAPTAGRNLVVPRLVIVIDEFRVLAEELPDFIAGLVRIAAVGRSLGVHLVLATQRPAGVVTADIKANVNLRIALRMRDRADSDDVLDAPDAASISERTPGRALARSGGNEARTFQTARVGGRAPRASGGLTVSPLSGLGVPAGLTAPAAPAADAGPGGRMPAEPSDLSLLVAALRRAAEDSSVPFPVSPWLPPLPDVVLAHGLDDHGAPSPWRLPLGLADRPAAQTQEPLVWDLRTVGHWAAVGTTGTGRTTLARLVATAAASRLGPEDLHVYAVDGGGGLRVLESLPHTGAVVPGDDLPRVDRLVGRLSEEVARRRRVAAGLLGPGQDPPLMLLVLDGWDQVAQAADSLDHGALTDRLLALLRDGASVGLRVLATGGRGLLHGPVASLFDRRLVLRLADRTDAIVAGLPLAGLPTHQPPGRAVVAPEGTEVQLAWPEPAAAPLDGAAAPSGRVGRAAAGVPERHTDGSRLPLRVPTLPSEVVLDEALASGASPGTVLVGVGGDAVEPVGLAPPTDGRLWLVAGSPRSGTSTALRTIAQSLLGAGARLAVVTARPGPLDDLRAHPGVACWAGPDDAGALIAARQQHPGLSVLVDDADTLLDTPVEPVLREIGRLADRDGGLLVCAAKSATLATQYRGVAVEVARQQSGLLLCPQGPAEGDLLGVRVPRWRERVAGRGLLVRRGSAIELQVARAGGPGSAAP